ncbi:MAG TPA: hypothetical protein VGD33_03140 [Chitinophagaceae bacterium]
MKRLLLFGFLFVHLCLHSQQFSVKDFIGFTEYNTSKFDAFILKKDYKRDYNSIRESPSITSYYKVVSPKDEFVHRQIHIEQIENKTSIYYTTSSKKEAASLKQQFNALKFNSYLVDSSNMFLEKDNITISTFMEQADSVELFGIYISKTELPKVRDILFAEDLLQLISHEFIGYVYGKENVVKDEFYFTASETNNCSILFPNSDKEVIFIWQDEQKYREPGFLIFGANIKTNISSNYTNTVVQNIWRSRQGLYCGMSLQELEILNNKGISFYGWKSDRPGMLTNANSGEIDFTRTAVILSCLNCGEVNDKNYILHSADAIRESLRIYVSSIVVLPDRQKSYTRD